MDIQIPSWNWECFAEILGFGPMRIVLSGQDIVMTSMIRSLQSPTLASHFSHKPDLGEPSCLASACCTGDCPTLQGRMLYFFEPAERSWSLVTYTELTSFHGRVSQLTSDSFSLWETVVEKGVLIWLTLYLSWIFGFLVTAFDQIEMTFWIQKLRFGFLDSSHWGRNPKTKGVTRNKLGCAATQQNPHQMPGDGAVGKT